MSEDTTNQIEETEEAPEHGLPGHMVRIIIISLVLVCMLLSGFGNIATWTNGVEGVDYAIAFGTGIISEVIGAVLLVVIIWCLARPNLQRLLMAVLFLPVWSMATFQNASASWSYYVEASNADEVAAAQARAVEKRQALMTQANLAQERIDEIKSELSFIGMTRTPDEIRTERDRLPDNYVTKRAKLTAELNKAERRIALDTELTQQRSTLSQTAGAGVIASDTSQNVSVSQTQAASMGVNIPANAAEITDVWSFLQFVQTNRLGSLVMVMEVMKSFGLLLVNVVFSGETRRKSKEKAQARQVRTREKSANKERQASNGVPSSTAWDAYRAQSQASNAHASSEQGSAKVIPMTAPVQSKPVVEADIPAQFSEPATSATAAVEPKAQPKTVSNLQFADEEPASPSTQSSEETEEPLKQGGIGISSKFV